MNEFNGKAFDAFVSRLVDIDTDECDGYLCPECVAGKHKNCDGSAWCTQHNDTTFCDCECCNFETNESCDCEQDGDTIVRGLE